MPSTFFGGENKPEAYSCVYQVIMWCYYLHASCQQVMTEDLACVEARGLALPPGSLSL